MHQLQHSTESPEKDPHQASGRSITDLLSDYAETETLEEETDKEVPEVKSSEVEEGEGDDSPIAKSAEESADLEAAKRMANPDPELKKRLQNNVAIIISGMWWKRKKQGGTISHWNGKAYVEGMARVMGATKVRLYDGSSIGRNKTVIGRIFGNWLPAARRKRGYRRGKRDAAEIFQQLGPGGTVRILTNSMGDAFERGFSEALKDYAQAYNAKIEAWNRILLAVNPHVRLPKLPEKVEYVMSASSYQGRAIGHDKNAKVHKFMRAPKEGFFRAILSKTGNFPSTYGSSKIPGAEEVSDKTTDGKTREEIRAMPKKERKAFLKRRKKERKDRSLHPMSGHGPYGIRARGEDFFPGGQMNKRVLWDSKIEIWQEYGKREVKERKERRRMRREARRMKRRAKKK
ncbi:MAG TPA: hypothetical protein DCE41_26075 [Cytophagales bacterium]|nr:hypothetical protein [Cytophagales bacterium]HAP63862.1 hypothetical protein [Cytophagales bacterium]